MHTCDLVQFNCFAPILDEGCAIEETMHSPEFVDNEARAACDSPSLCHIQSTHPPRCFSNARYPHPSAASNIMTRKPIWAQMPFLPINNKEENGGE